MVNPSPSCPGARGYPLAQEASIRYARACSVRGPCAGIFTGRVIRGRTFAGAHNLRSSLYEVPLMGLPLVPMTVSWPADTKLFVRGTTATRKGHSAQNDALSERIPGGLE